MKFASVTFSQAEAELIEITTYLNSKRENLGLDFLYEYRNTVERLSQYPQGFRLSKKGFREIQVGKFKFLVIYKFHSRRVWIHRIVHTSRKPSLRYKSR